MIYLIHSTSHQLLSAQLNTLMQTFNPMPHIEHIDGANVAIDEWLKEAIQPSLWNDTKLVIISQPNFFGKSPSQIKGKKEHDLTLETFIHVLENPPESLHIIIKYQGEIDERLMLFKLLKKHHQVIHLRVPSKEGWPALLQSWQKKFDVSLTPRAFTLLIDYCFPDVDKAYMEIFKLSTYASQIDEIIVQNLVHPQLEDNVFAMTNQLMADNLAGALTIHRDLQIMQIEPVMLIALIAKHFQLFAKVAYLLNQNMSNAMISSELNVHEYRIKLMSQVRKKFPSKRINQILFSLDALDASIKSGEKEKNEALSWWLLKFN